MNNRSIFPVYIYLLFLNPLRIVSTSVRVIRSSTNSTKIINHVWEPEITTQTSTTQDLCTIEDVDNSTHRTAREIRQKFFNVALPTPGTTVTISIDISSLSEEFQECAHVVIEPGCYIALDNGSVIVPLYDKLFKSSDYVINEVGELFVCPKFFDEFIDNSKFSTTLDIFSVVGVAISTFCLVLHVTMFLILKNLRNLPGYCLFSLCLALLIAYVCTFIQLGVLGRSDCTAIGMIMFYSFLASFFWMNVMSYDVWRSLRMATAKLRLTKDRPMFTRFALYSSYSWGGPLIIVIVALIVNHIENSDHRYNLTFNTDTCWFYYKQALLVYFALPFFVLLFSNLLLFVSSFLMISRATMNTAENRTALWSRFLVSMRLAIVMGLLWICGIMAAATQAMFLWYIYSIINTFQGVFIFFSFSFSEKTVKECKRVMTNRKNSKFLTHSSSRGQSSTRMESTF